MVATDSHTHVLGTSIPSSLHLPNWKSHLIPTCRIAPTPCKKRTHQKVPNQKIPTNICRWGESCKAPCRVQLICKECKAKNTSF